jgi:hypothetical protein
MVGACCLSVAPEIDVHRKAQITAPVIRCFWPDNLGAQAEEPPALNKLCYKVVWLKMLGYLNWAERPQAEEYLPRHAYH